MPGLSPSSVLHMARHTSRALGQTWVLGVRRVLTVLLCLQDLAEKFPDATCDAPGVPVCAPASAHPPDHPTQQPADPTRQPNDPTRQPGDPARQPADPARQASDPTRQPNDPIRQPTDPTRRPTDPTRQPRDTTPVVAAASATTVAVTAESAGPDDLGVRTTAHSPASTSLAPQPSPSSQADADSRPPGGDESSQVTKRNAFVMREVAKCHADVMGDGDGGKKTGIRKANTPAVDLSQDLLWLSFRNTHLERQFRHWVAAKGVRVSFSVSPLTLSSQKHVCVVPGSFWWFSKVMLSSSCYLISSV
jgi:hypothetical protein